MWHLHCGGCWRKLFSFPFSLIKRFALISVAHMSTQSRYIFANCSASLSDFMVKVVEVSDSSQQKTLRGHEAPVLSVAFDPKDDFLVGKAITREDVQLSGMNAS